VRQTESKDTSDVNNIHGYTHVHTSEVYMHGCTHNTQACIQAHMGVYSYTKMYTGIHRSTLVYVSIHRHTRV